MDLRLMRAKVKKAVEKSDWWLRRRQTVGPVSRDRQAGMASACSIARQGESAEGSCTSGYWWRVS